jgi:hypothetical protein
VAVTAGRTVWFPGAAVMAGWCGLGGGDSRSDDAVPEHGSDGDDGGGSSGGSGVV